MGEDTDAEADEFLREVLKDEGVLPYEQQTWREYVSSLLAEPQLTLAHTSADGRACRPTITC